ncbi:MAG TPA: nucleotidyl transferase AbiEii/AbiGii toxin family protein [Solirubrobacterales bacterium]|nr:nucleotidyl transferase AbiEii/AbiGii toxin family protein [Solirubrobacterales bacterium]
MTEQQARRELHEEPALPEKVIVIHEALRDAKIPHALGGALALAYYAEPRATIDIDINVFLPTERWPQVVELLASLGVDASKLDSVALERDGQCRLWWGHNPVDLFFSYSPIHAEMKREFRRVPFSDATVPVLSPEHLAVCKAMFDRRKDWLDIEQMLIGVDDLDTSKIEGWLKRMVGEDDQRLAHLRELELREKE